VIFNIANNRHWPTWIQNLHIINKVLQRQICHIF
jgi:hypothetical protein